MRLKSAYREKPVEQPSNIPEPSEKISVEVHDAVAPDVAAIEPPQSDEATLTLQKQIADLKKSEELQKQYALHVAAARAQPPTRQQKLEMWRQQGADEGDLQFLAEQIRSWSICPICAVPQPAKPSSRVSSAERHSTGPPR